MLAVKTLTSTYWRAERRKCQTRACAVVPSDELEGIETVCPRGHHGRPRRHLLSIAKVRHQVLAEDVRRGLRIGGGDLEGIEVFVGISDDLQAGRHARAGVHARRDVDY